MKTLPLDTYNNLSNILDNIQNLKSGYYQIDYYTGDLTVCGVYLPNGLCCCNEYNSINDVYEYSDFEWDSFSEYTQRMILLEIGDRYC